MKEGGHSSICLPIAPLHQTDRGWRKQMITPHVLFSCLCGPFALASWWGVTQIVRLGDFPWAQAPTGGVQSPSHGFSVLRVSPLLLPPFSTSATSFNPQYPPKIWLCHLKPSPAAENEALFPQEATLWPASPECQCWWRQTQMSQFRLIHLPQFGLSDMLLLRCSIMNRTEFL